MSQGHKALFEELFCDVKKENRCKENMEVRR